MSFPEIPSIRSAASSKNSSTMSSSTEGAHENPPGAADSAPVSRVPVVAFFSGGAAGVPSPWGLLTASPWPPPPCPTAGAAPRAGAPPRGVEGAAPPFAGAAASASPSVFVSSERGSPSTRAPDLSAFRSWKSAAASASRGAASIGSAAETGTLPEATASRKASIASARRPTSSAPTRRLARPTRNARRPRSAAAPGAAAASVAIPASIAVTS